MTFFSFLATIKFKAKLGVLFQYYSLSLVSDTSTSYFLNDSWSLLNLKKNGIILNILNL